jgi:hypothetical protein
MTVESADAQQPAPLARAATGTEPAAGSASTPAPTPTPKTDPEPAPVADRAADPPVPGAPAPLTGLLHGAALARATALDVAVLAGHLLLYPTGHRRPGHPRPTRRPRPGPHARRLRTRPAHRW